MIRHTVVFRFRPEVDPATVEDVLARLRTFPAHFPAMRRFSAGPNVSDRDDRFTHAFSVEFDTRAALSAYLTSDLHETFVAEVWRPVIAERAIVSYEYTPAQGDLMTAPTSTRPHAPYGMEYARIEVPDMQATIDFLVYHVGLQLEGRTEDRAYLRADIEHHSVELVAAPHRTVGETVAIGFSVEDDDVLASLQKRVVEAGLEVLELDERQRALCSDGFAVVDPNGLAVELFTGYQEYAEPPHVEIRPVDLIHPFIITERFEESVAFYQGVLGFLPSDHVVGSTTFFRGEDRYHHSLALARSRGEGTMVAHLCFAMKSFDHVMRLRARALYKGSPIASDLVNHSASTSIAFYLHDEAHGPRFELCDRHRVFTPEEHETHKARFMPADPRNIDVWRPASDDWGRF
jgi:catechol 2,3-dioxygenase-like lactoylglutathione lyase family enzyme